MSWRGDLITRLRGDAALASAFATRIAFFEAARSWSAYPQLVLQEVSAERLTSHQGFAGLERVRVQFDIYARTASTLEAGEAALIAAMEQDSTTVGSTTFKYGFLSDRSMSVEDLGDQQRVHRLRLDFEFHWCASS